MCISTVCSVSKLIFFISEIGPWEFLFGGLPSPFLTMKLPWCPQQVDVVHLPALLVFGFGCPNTSRASVSLEHTSIIVAGDRQKMTRRRIGYMQEKRDKRHDSTTWIQKSVWSFLGWPVISEVVLGLLPKLEMHGWFILFHACLGITGTPCIHVIPSCVCVIFHTAVRCHWKPPSQLNPRIQG